MDYASIIGFAFVFAAVFIFGVVLGSTLTDEEVD